MDPDHQSINGLGDAPPVALVKAQEPRLCLLGHLHLPRHREIVQCIH